MTKIVWPGYQELLLFWQVLLHTSFISWIYRASMWILGRIWKIEIDSLVHLWPTARRDNGEPGVKEGQFLDPTTYLHNDVGQVKMVKMVGDQWWRKEPSDPLQPRTPPEWSHRFPKVGRMSKNYLKFPTQIISILNLDQLKGTVLQMINFCLNLIFWIVMGGGIAHFGRRGL